MQRFTNPPNLTTTKFTNYTVHACDTYDDINGYSYVAI